MNIALLGAGTVGLSVDRILKNLDGFTVSKILTRTCKEEIRDRFVNDIRDIVEDDSIDTVVEVIGGLHPSYEYVTEALKHHKNVVTANKALVSAYYDELLTLAYENGVSIRFTSAVGGSIPWLVNLGRAKRAGRITEIGGILNGTTNFILDEMKEKSVDFSDALKQAQALGYAEADPTADIDGLDARRKLALSVNVAFNASVDEESIPTLGIRFTKMAFLREAEKNGTVLKLVGRAKKADNGQLCAYLEPQFVAKNEPLAHIPSNFNMIYYTCEYAGTQSFVGQGAGGYPTGYNVVEDLLDLNAGVPGYTGEFEKYTLDNSNEKHPYFVYSEEAFDDFIKENTDSCKEKAVILKPVSVEAMHAWAKERLKSDASLFVAGIMKE